MPDVGNFHHLIRMIRVPIGELLIRVLLLLYQFFQQRMTILSILVSKDGNLVSPSLNFFSNLIFWFQDLESTIL